MGSMGGIGSIGTVLIFRFTLKEAIRRRLFLAVVVLSILFLAVFTILFSLVVNYSAPPYGVDPQIFLLGIGAFMTLPAIWLVYLLSSALTILLTTNMISGEIEAGTFVIIVPKPLRRFEIVLGKWLCYALLLSLYTAILFFTFLGVIYWKTGYWPVDVLSALGILELVVFVLLAITTLGSVLTQTLVNGAIALILFIGAQISSFVQLIVPFVAPTQKDSVQNVTTVINLIMPTDALWHGSSYYLTSGASDLLQLAHADNTPFTSNVPIATALLIWGVCYSILLPALAAWRFQHRDL